MNPLACNTGLNRSHHTGLQVKLLDGDHLPVGLRLGVFFVRPVDPEAVAAGLVLGLRVVVGRATPLPVEHGVGLGGLAHRVVLAERVLAPVVTLRCAVLGHRVVAALGGAVDAADADQSTGVVQVADGVGQV